MNTLGARLSYLREKKGWTKTYVSKKLGMKTVSTYANWEYDTRQPDNDMIVRLAEIFEVPTDFLLGADSNDSKKISEKDERDIAKRMAKMKKDLIEGNAEGEGLNFMGEPMSEEAVESLLEALEHAERIATLANKKFAPNKYRDK